MSYLLDDTKEPTYLFEKLIQKEYKAFTDRILHGTWDEPQPDPYPLGPLTATIGEKDRGVFVPVDTWHNLVTCSRQRQGILMPESEPRIELVQSPMKTALDLLETFLIYFCAIYGGLEMLL